MGTVTVESQRLRDSIAANRSAVGDVLRRYHARNPRLFGSAARGDATSKSDLDLLVDLDPGQGDDLLRIAGISEELSRILGVRVDAVAVGLLRSEVSATAIADAIPL